MNCALRAMELEVVAQREVYFSNNFYLFRYMRPSILHLLKSNRNIDPLGQPTVTAGRDHCFSTYRPSVRPHFSKSNKTNKVKTILAIGENVGLAERIIDDTCLVFHILRKKPATVTLMTILQILEANF